jgi:hypothetical protein
MATKKYIAAELRKLLDPRGFENFSDDDIIKIANTCQCGRQIFDSDQLESFITRSETTDDFLLLVFSELPKHNGEKNGCLPD